MTCSEKYIEILVRGVTVVDNKLLLCHTKGASNRYLPGGHVEFNEGAKSALEREIMEELGALSHAGDFLGAVEHRFLQKGEAHCEINLLFLLEIEGLNAQMPPESAEDYLEFDWLPLSELPVSDLEPAVLRGSLPEWLKRHSRWADFS